ncbi:unnamed protein product [Cladocopium goreaui]|uniref:J domain-containing protein n=1 Tax=Cladocopium goreaui TaxID=2562237 RepID=A0A9P1DAC9_9DINO|nr:unnamed protein product [Cladocopium goreaui]
MFLRVFLRWATGSSAGCNAKFSSKCVKPELDGLNNVLVEFQQMERQLSTFCDPQYREAALKAIQLASRQISSSDILGEIAGVWEEWKEHERNQRELEMEQGKKEGVLKIKEAEKDFLKIRLDAAAEETKRAEQILREKRVESQDLKRNKDNSAKDFILRWKAAKEEAKRKLQELQEKLEEAERESRGPVDACEEKIASLQRQSLNLDHVNINHIIFVVDNSGSMSGSSFRSATKAVEDFRAACVHAGSMDKVSLVSFNHVAKCLVKVCQIFVVFLSDGYTWDLGQAATKAQAIFSAAEKSKRAMTTCFVHISEGGSNEKIRSDLEPLVKAANGGLTVVKYVEEKIPLLQIVKSEELVQAFMKLTSLVNMQKCLLDVRLSILQRQEQEYRTRQAEASKALQARLRDEAKRLEEVAKEAEKTSKAGNDHVEGLFKSLQNQMDQEIKELGKDVDKARRIEQDLKEHLVKCEAEYKGLQSEFEKSKPAYEQMSSTLQKMTATHLSQTNRVHEKQKQLVDRFGSTNSRLLTQQLESLQRMKDQLSRNSVIEEDRSAATLKIAVLLACFLLRGRDCKNDLHCIVNSVVRFTNILKAQIENPAPLSDQVSNAKVALKMISHQRGLEYKNNPQEDMAKLLEYEANLQCKDPEEAANITKTLVDAGISAEEICAAINAEDADRVKETKEELIASLQQRILEQQDCGSEGLERKIKSKKKELEVKKEELLGLLREVKASKRKGKTTRSNVSTSTSEEENQEWELIEDLEEKVESLKEEKETLEESLKTLEKDLKDIKKDQKAICKDLKPCRLVLEFTVDSCRTAFLEYLAEKEKDALKGIFESFQNNVRAPITAFAAMTEQARQVFEHDASIPLPQSKTLCDTDR